VWHREAAAERGAPTAKPDALVWSRPPDGSAVPKVAFDLLYRAERAAEKSLHHGPRTRGGAFAREPTPGMSGIARRSLRRVGE
jgi:hypothetical protein